MVSNTDSPVNNFRRPSIGFIKAKVAFAHFPTPDQEINNILDAIPKGVLARAWHGAAVFGSNSFRTR